jgi:heat shock protein HslJ
MPYRIVVLSLVLLCASCARPIAEPPALETLGETEWLLRSWDGEDPAPGEPPVTLTYTEGRFAGRSGCNSYSGPVETGELPGSIVIGPILSTRMACAELHMQVESRYLKNLQAVTKFAVTDGDLTLTYQDEADASRVMLFSPPEDTRP